MGDIDGYVCRDTEHYAEYINGLNCDNMTIRRTYGGNVNGIDIPTSIIVAYVQIDKEENALENTGDIPTPPNKKEACQSISFDSIYWTFEDAERWLKDNGLFDSVILWKKADNPIKQ